MKRVAEWTITVAAFVGLFTIGAALHADNGTRSPTPGAAAALPVQSGHSGQFLSTDGARASWSAVSALPTQSGNSGKFLTTNGTAASWASTLTCPTCSSTVSLLYNPTSTTAAPSPYVYDSGGVAGQRVCDSSLLYCWKLDSAFAEVGYKTGVSAHSGWQATSTGIAGYVGGVNEISDDGTATTIHHKLIVTSTGVQFPDSTVQSTAAAAADEYTYKLKDYVTNAATGLGTASANETHGTSFFFSKAATITGANFYWCSPTARTIRVKLWQNNALMQIQDVSVPAATGWYTATFASSTSISAWANVQVSYWDTAAGSGISCKFTAAGAPGTPPVSRDLTVVGTAAPTVASIGGPHFFWQAWSLWASGDAQPITTAGTERYPIEPIFTVP